MGERYEIAADGSCVELRPECELDEAVCPACSLHLEYLSDSHVWIGVYPAGSDARYVVNLWTEPRRVRWWLWRFLWRWMDEPEGPRIHGRVERDG